MKAASRNRSIRLVIIDSDPRARAYVRQSFIDHDVRVVGEADDVKSGMRFVRGLVPDVVLIELPENASETMEALKTIRDEHPEVGVIVSRHDPSPQLILSGIRAGAQEFVSRPIDFPELERAIEHVRRVMMKTTLPVHKRGTVVSVFSGKGGIGASSVAANLAVALAGHKDTRTALVDLSFQIGDLGLMLDEPPRYSLVDALSEGRLDESRLRSVLTQHGCGVNLLTVAASPELGEEITRHHMIELFGILTGIFDFVVVDVGRQLDDRTAEVLDLSDEILMLCTLDIPSIRNASRYLDVFQKMDLDRERFRLVINRYQKKTRLAPKDAEEALGMSIFWTIPNDFEPMSIGIDSGAPAVLNSRRSKVAKNLKELAERLCDRTAGGAPAIGATGPGADAAEGVSADAVPHAGESEFVYPDIRRAAHATVTDPRPAGNFDVNAS
jgi:pilus assembly protein CpaE